VIRKWLFDTALPLWAGVGVDRAHGGVYEALNHDGSPADLGYKRLRVLARQIYCFANAELVGWEGDARAVLEHCFTTLTTTGWHAEGGWIHLWNPDGTVKDPQRDTYDQCFVLLALAWLWKATKWPEAWVWAERTIAYMDDHLVDRAHGGFYESSLQARLPPRQPAHALSRGDAGLVRGHRRACLPRSRPDRGGAVQVGFLQSRKLECHRAFRARLVRAQGQAGPRGAGAPL
jgi:mannose/cellobiose epimerase-like protein (N-acyl-D-glucosamine 2-epimerase family)